MADDDMMDFDDVIEEEASGDEGLVIALSVFTTIFIIVAIVVCLIKLKEDYGAGLLA